MNQLTRKVKTWSDDTKSDFTKKLEEVKPGESFECDGVLCTANSEKEFSALDLESGDQATIKVEGDKVNFCETKTYSDDSQLVTGDRVKFEVMGKTCTGTVTISDADKVTIDIDEACNADLFNVTLPVSKVSKVEVEESKKEFTFEDKVEDHAPAEDPKPEEKTFCENGDKCYVNTPDGYVECTVKDNSLDADKAVEIEMPDGSTKRVAMDVLKWENPMSEEAKTFSELDGSPAQDASDVVPVIAVGDNVSTPVFDRTVSGVVKSIKGDQVDIEVNDGTAAQFTMITTSLEHVAKLFSDDDPTKVETTETKVETDPADEPKEVEVDVDRINSGLGGAPDKEEDPIPASDPAATVEGSKVFSYSAEKTNPGNMIDTLLSLKSK